MSLNVHRNAVVRGVRWLGATARLVSFTVERVQVRMDALARMSCVCVCALTWHCLQWVMCGCMCSCGALCGSMCMRLWVLITYERVQVLLHIHICACLVSL